MRLKVEGRLECAEVGEELRGGSGWPCMEDSEAGMGMED